MKPNAMAIKTLKYLIRIIPTWKLTPTPDIVDLAFRDPNVRNEVNIIFLSLNILLRTISTTTKFKKMSKAEKKYIFINIVYMDDKIQGKTQNEIQNSIIKT